MFKQHFFTLSNGNKIPAPSTIGTGSIYYKKNEKDYNPHLTEYLIKCFKDLKGIVHIDSAACYNTYPEVADALKENFEKGYKTRDEIWYTDKFDSKGGKDSDPITHVNETLKKLNLEYFDLYLIHHPSVSEKIDKDIVGVWKDFITLFEQGKVKNIGVSNFSAKDIDNLVEKAGFKPVVNQIEWNPFLFNQSPEIYSYCQKNDIVIEAYGPLSPLVSQLNGSDTSKEGKDFKNYLDELASKYKVSNSVILLAYTIDMNVLPVTTSTKFYRIEDAHNFINDHPELKLTKEEINKITALGLNHPTARRYRGWTDHYNEFESESQKLKI
ncbi:Aldo/keto reductase [Hanseniaspora valbyensis NRRL Y-1626]|uniref:Aldo/keto reductase n=1 Tax=Hanseniaspora valbyensis NRRL Y-1626 TaxID=766949 RepID=A0A1B7T9E9_9ASCO|nr:Aldo/keto reductase [Hanseniaspora valbyensis NRRL Y-1626]